MNEVDIEFSEETTDNLKITSALTGISFEELTARAALFQLNYEKVGANKPANSTLGAIADTASQISRLFSDLSEQLDGLNSKHDELPCFLRK